MLSLIANRANRIVFAVQRTVRKWITTVSILVGLGIAGVWAYRHFTDQKKEAPKFETRRVERGRLVASVTATGTLSPRVTVQVGSQVSGRILELYADFNDRVEKGQVIARIDPKLFESDVAKVKASVMSAQASVKRAQSDFAEAKRQYDRTRSLSEKQLVSQAEADTALAAYQSAEAQLEAARAALAQARALLVQSETNLAYTTIVSPINGVVISRDVDVGQTVAASLQAPKLFTIAEDLRKMEVHTNVAESDVGRLKPNMVAEFTVDAFPQERFRGAVKEVRYSPQTVQNVVTYDAVVSIENEELKLRPGMTANVTFIVETRDNALKIPNSALRFRPPSEVASSEGKSRDSKSERSSGDATSRNPSKRRIWKLASDGTLQPVFVTIGISDGRFTEIIGDTISKDDLIVTGIDGASTPETNSGSEQRSNNRPRPGRFL